MENRFFANSFEFFKNTLWKGVHKDAATMLIIMGSLGFMLSSLAQCWAIKINDKIDKKKKTFMIAQEASDGVVNVGLYLAFTSGVWKISDKLLKMSGLCQFSNKKNAPLTFKPNGKSHLKAGARIVTTMAASVLACNVATPLIRNIIAGKIQDKADKKEQYENYLLANFKKSMPNTAFQTFHKYSYPSLKNSWLRV